MAMRVANESTKNSCFAARAKLTQAPSLLGRWLSLQMILANGKNGMPAEKQFGSTLFTAGLMTTTRFSGLDRNY